MFFCSFSGYIFLTTLVPQSILGLIFVVGTISDALVLASEHQVEAIGCATVAGFIFLRGMSLFSVVLKAYCYLFLVLLWAMLWTSNDVWISMLYVHGRHISNVFMCSNHVAHHEGAFEILRKEATSQCRI